jgi:signal transduction histidine kinase
MRYFRRYLVLIVAVILLYLWPGGVEGPTAWLVRILAVVAAAGIATKWAVAPWKEFEVAASRVREGDFAARLDDISPGDLAVPSETFNTMAHDLYMSLELAHQREQRLMAVLAATDRAILVLDRDGDVVLTSPVTFALFPRFSEKGGVPSLALPGLGQLIDDATQNRGTLRRKFEEGERGRGRVFVAQVTPLQNEGSVIYLRDITQEVHLERMKADLVANVSHELRTPLTALTSLSETLADDALPPDRRAYFSQRFEHQITRMKALVDDLLSLSRLEAEEMAPKSEEVVLSTFCPDLVRSLQPLAESASVTLHVDCSGNPSVLTDRSLLEMAVRNLVDNGIRYNRPGGRVRLRCIEEDRSVNILVEDTGEGIPNQHLTRIFERFYRVDPHRSRERGGTGLGLAIVKHAVNKLGGEIDVQSTVGKGTTFTITIPREQGGSEETAGAAPSAGAAY